MWGVVFWEKDHYVQALGRRGFKLFYGKPLSEDGFRVSIMEVVFFYLKSMYDPWRAVNFMRKYRVKESVGVGYRLYNLRFLRHLFDYVFWGDPWCADKRNTDEYISCRGRDEPLWNRFYIHVNNGVTYYGFEIEREIPRYERHICEIYEDMVLSRKRPYVFCGSAPLRNPYMKRILEDLESFRIPYYICDSPPAKNVLKSYTVDYNAVLKRGVTLYYTGEIRNVPPYVYVKPLLTEKGFPDDWTRFKNREGIRKFNIRAAYFYGSREEADLFKEGVVPDFTR